MSVGRERFMQRRSMLPSLAAGIVIVTGCGGASVNAPQKVEIIQGLHVKRVQIQDLPDELEAPGSVIAVSTAQIAARTMGTVLQVTAKEGEFVKRGQLLAQLDDREMISHCNAAQAASQSASAGVAQATNALAAAQAQADVMQKTYDRFVYLKEQKSVSPQEFDEINAKQQAAQAGLEQAKAGLKQAEAGSTQAQSEAKAAQEVASYTRIVAPFDGRVTRRTVEPGSLVAPGTPLFVVEDASLYQLDATVPAEGLAAAKKNSPARVDLDAIPGKSLAGRIAEVEAGVDPTSHTLKARIDLPKEAGVQSGMFGRAFLSQGQKKALVVSTNAVVVRGQLRGIYVVDDSGLIHWRVVTLGKPFGNDVEVLSGLNNGDAIVLDPGPQELDGKKTTVVGNSEKHS